MNQELMLFCYTCVAIDMDAEQFGKVISSARKFYEDNKIRGLLMYDGRYFLHYITGSRDSILRAKTRLETTVNAYDWDVLYLEKVEQYPPEYPGWQLGYIHADEDQGYLERLRMAKGDLAQLSDIFAGFHNLEDVH